MLTAEIQYISPVEGVADELTAMGGDAAKLVDNPLVNPTDEFLAALAIFGPLEPGRGGEVRQAVLRDHRLGLIRGRSATTRDGSTRPLRALAAARARAALPVLVLLLPALHARPDVAVVVAEPVRGPGVRLALGQLRQRVLAVRRASSSARSCTRLAATLLALVIAYPLAYVIAFRGGRFKNLLLGLVVVPFFTNFLIRTLAWKTILGDQGTVVALLRDVGILGSDRARCCARRSP